MSAVFLDTVGLLALWDTNDQWHSLALPAFQALLSARRSLVSTTFIMLECGNVAARRPYRLDVDDLRRELLAGNRLIEPTPDEISHAWNAYRAGFAGDAGIVDQISFAVMRRLGITDAFTHDRHFEAAGFKNLF